MVTRLILAFCCAVATASCGADQCTKGSEFEPPLCPLHLPSIAKVEISENAAKSPAEKNPAVTCADFRLDERQVRRFFSLAKLTNANDTEHTLDWSPCYAAGRLKLADGGEATWRIDQYRRGSLVVGSDPEMVLYCPRCEFKPFQW